MTGYTFPQLIDFTRTSAATFVNSSGNIASTPQSRNLLTFTQEFDNAAWSKAGATVTANSTAAPDGTSTADTLVENSATSGHSASQAVSGTTIGLTYTATVYAKPNGRNWIILEMFGASTYASFNVATGTVGTAVGSPTTSITAVGNGWYRCTISKTIGGAITSFRVYLASADNTETYAGNGTSGAFIWGAQLEQASAATDYTRNFGGLFPPRFDYDPVTRAPRGLLIEEQRTNLLLRSEEFDNAAWFKGNTTVTANAVVSPDGTVDADQVDFAAVANANIQAASAISVTPGTAYTFSVYVRAAAPVTNVNLSLQGTDSAISVGTSWTRVSMTVTASGSTLTPTIVTRNSVAATIYLYGAQLEAGAFATSYIPTVASQVTRTADQAAINAPNFASWFNAAEGSFVAEFDVVSTATASKVFFTTSNGTSDNINTGYVFTNAGVFAEVRSGGVTQATLSIGTATPNATFKAASAYRANDFAGSGNGGAVQTDASGAVPLNQTELNLGYSRNYGGLYLNGHLRSIRYYPTRLTNAQLQALTA